MYYKKTNGASEDLKVDYWIGRREQKIELAQDMDSFWTVQLRTSYAVHPQPVHSNNEGLGSRWLHGLSYA